MTNEFKKIAKGDTTRFVLEFSSGGVTGTAAVGTGVASPMGAVQRRNGANLINQEGKKDRKDPIRVKSPVAKAHQSIGTGSGEHKNPKHTIPRKEKHKKPAGMSEAGYGRNKGYHQGFASPTAPRLGSGREDDEYHNGGDYDPELERNRKETMMYNIKVDGQIVNPKPIFGRSAAIAWAKEQVSAGTLDPKTAMLSPVQYNEEFDREYDDEAGMANNNLETMKRAVAGLDSLIHKGDNLPEWCQEKIAVAKSMLVAVWDYMASEEQGVAEGVMSNIHLEIGELLDPYIEKYKNGLLDADHLMHLISKSAELLGKKHNSDPAEFQKMVSDYVEQEAGGEEPDEYTSSLESKLAEKLSPQADVGDWVDDFKQADPQKYHQFRNKNDAKKQQMAVAAYMAAKDPNKHKQ